MLYVAYGSNMNIEQMKRRCPSSKIVGNGIIDGWKLYFNIHANIKKGNKNDFVPVVIWDINDHDWAKLDLYEGFPTYYTKEIIKATKCDGDSVYAIVYVMAKDCTGICPPNRDYFYVCLDGYYDNGIDAKPLFKALDFSFDNKTEYNKHNFRKTVKKGVI